MTRTGPHGAGPPIAPEVGGGPGGRVRVLVVDEFPIARVGLRSLISGYPGFEVVGEADELAAAEECARRLQPDLLIIDPVMSHGDGFRTLSTLRQELPRARLLFLAKTDDPDVAREAIRCGADGFLVKTVSQAALLSAVTRLMHGGAVIDQRIAMNALRSARPMDGDQSPPAPLTPRELEVLRLLSLGRTNPQIARHLFMAVGTVKVHVEHIIGKLAAADRTDAAVRAAGMGLLRPGAEEER